MTKVDVADGVELISISSAAFNNSPNVTLYCSENSEAKDFAEKHNINYVINKAEAPAKPILSQPTATHNTVTLRWDKVDKATGYEVWRDDVKVSDVTANEYEDNGFSQSTEYTYKIRAYQVIVTGKSKAYSDFSDEVSATTGIKVEPVGSIITSSSVSGSNQAKINLACVMFDSSYGYELQRSLDGSVYETIKSEKGFFNLRRQQPRTRQILLLPCASVYND